MDTSSKPIDFAFVGFSESEQFKYVLNELASGNPNPKERRRLVREIRDSIKTAAAAQIGASVETLSTRNWIKVGERLPAPYQEVRILFNGVPRIARLNHASEYFQLATFVDSTKSQYVAPFEQVAGWMPLPDAPEAAPT